MKEENYAVLGTTVNAAFVDEIIGEKIDFFIDENDGKGKRIFRKKRVVNPRELDAKTKIILPYGESGIKIKERFENNYKGIYILI